jgi:hypothetical protein
MTLELTEVEFVSGESKLSKLLLGSVRHGKSLGEFAQMYAPGPYRVYLLEGQDVDDTLWIKLAIKFDCPNSEEALLWRLKWL